MRAAIYTRISDDREGRELGVTRQLEDCQRYLDRQGYTLVEIYTDNDRSASAYAKRIRPRYRALLKDAATGRFDVIIAYTSSRITRKTREALDLIDLAQDHGIQFEYIRSPKHDLNTAEGRRRAKHEAVDNEAESDITSERVLADVRRRAEAGEFHGGPLPFGYEAVWSVIDRRERITGFELHPVHSTWVRSAADRVLAGESIYGICADWNAKGRTNGQGNRWQARTLRTLLIRPAIAGKREHNGTLHDAPWPAIIDLTTHRRLVTVLTDPSRKKSEVNQRRHLLIGLLSCGLCGQRLRSKSQPPSYECTRVASHKDACGKIKIAREPIEQFITEAVFAALDSPEFRKARAETREDATEAEVAAQDTVTRWERSLAQLIDERDDPAIAMPDAEYKQRRARITANIDTARQALVTASRGVVHTNLPALDELRKVWPDRDNTWRRTIVSAVIDHIDVYPHPPDMAPLAPRRSQESATACHGRWMTTVNARTDIKWHA